MKFAYLILAHQNPVLLGRLIGTLARDDDAFFVHIDRKSRIEAFASIDASGVHLSHDRVAVHWAEYSMVEAILGLMRQALREAQPYDYLLLLSGSDYPLQRSEYIHCYIEARRGTQFISLAPIPNADAGLPLSKMTTFSISSSRPLLRAAVKLLARLGLARCNYRKALGSLTPFGGSTWWALTRTACEYIVKFADDNPRICRYFAHTHTPDETFFHTIIGNSPFAQRLHRSLTYDDWSTGGIHPAAITHEHLAFFEARERVVLQDAFGRGEVLFARKFRDARPDLVERLDAIIAARGATSEVSATL
jgi:hypothetical protein